MNRLVRGHSGRGPGLNARLPRRVAALLPAAALFTLLGAASGAGGLGAKASAATPVEPAVSSNWAGYAVARRSAGSSLAKFKQVSGTWVQPTPTCNSSGATYAAFWVGLGGFHSRKGLEQLGTEVDCSTTGAVTSDGWYELIPAGPRHLKLTIRPGDTISASVAVRAGRATLALTDRTTGGSFVRHVRVPFPDVSSAEWIVEAPSACDRFGNCSTLPLANFGTVTFSGASTTANGHTGAISDPEWSATPIELRYRAREFGRPDFTSAVTPGSAVPAGLASTGSAFSVSWQEEKAPQPAPPPRPLPGAGQP